MIIKESNGMYSIPTVCILGKFEYLLGAVAVDFDVFAMGIVQWHVKTG